MTFPIPGFPHPTGSLPNNPSPPFFKLLNRFSIYPNEFHLIWHHFTLEMTKCLPPLNCTEMETQRNVSSDTEYYRLDTSELCINFSHLHIYIFTHAHRDKCTEKDLEGLIAQDPKSPLEWGVNEKCFWFYWNAYTSSTPFLILDNACYLIAS